ncbi:hypothetical protein Knedl_CDS0018 [Pseudomonas phage Knedl]|nr:hypothetical protein Knedl_CDS0018 [Pseudomonas phage Knedl]
MPYPLPSHTLWPKRCATGLFGSLLAGYAWCLPVVMLSYGLCGERAV